tara:strand:+ start:67 stop:1155 length:1089 start_codon:yes stop_codon:yes gene_type:complete
MAVTGADFLQSLNMILTSQQERERFKVQQSLAMMQFGQQKRMQNMQVAATSLDLMEKKNKQLMTEKATQFVSDLGLSGLYAKYKEKNDPLNEAISELTTKPGGFFAETYEIGLDKATASDLVSAIWYHQEGGNSKPLIEIGARLHGMGKRKMSGREILTYDAFKRLGYVSASGKGPEGLLQDFSDMGRLIDNEDQILRETDEFLKGDYIINEINLSRDIQKALGGLETEQVGGLVDTTEEKDEDLVEDEWTDVRTDLTLHEQLGEFDKVIDTKSDNIDKIKGALTDLESKARNLAFYKRAGKELNQEDADWLERVPEMRQTFESDIQNLSNEITESKEMKSKFRGEMYRRESLAFQKDPYKY